VVFHLGGKPVMVEDEARLGPFGAQLEARDRIHAGRPGLGAPCLDHQLIGDQLDVMARDVATEQTEEATFDACTSRRAPVSFENSVASTSV
jgi:hypothetical protein